MVNDDRIILPGYHNDPRTVGDALQDSVNPKTLFFTSMVLQAMSTFLSQPYP
ncbi:hypothetical protein L914_08939 [Phytophthora nicotianae]|uniref:Uncharacterized protein n=1 Tax=Phytophthora nicotianae TaxID=4792 RepID=W2IZY5_PHYNI|nr:hypothetical protein L916_08988 [Phytophthora nicotianae]ETM46135.1 hypothetical protein L914_08939 [Phytophthora nicotianae]